MIDDQKQRAAAFRALHVPGRPLVLFNIWDVGSAKAVMEAGASALATGSWSVAAANGYSDGELIPLQLAIDNAARIATALALPLSVDIESGYGREAEQVAGTVAANARAGAVGCNLEDSFPESGSMRALEDQIGRVAAARRGANDHCPGFFINARTDVFFQSPAAEHNPAQAEAALERARAYAGAGADGIFVPGLLNEGLIARICASSPLPVNVMVGKGSPSLQRMAAAGVARVSHGPGPFLLGMGALREAARSAMVMAA